jgi:hypothetical protein
MRRIFLILLGFSILMSSAIASLSHTLDIEGEGYLWTASDVGINHDRAGGTGIWTYGTMVNDQSLLSLYQFVGMDGFYSVRNSGNISQNVQAMDLTNFNASVKMNNETVDMQMNGTGRVKMVLSGSSEIKGHPLDLSRTYISGKFAIDNKHNVGAW